MLLYMLLYMPSDETRRGRFCALVGLVVMMDTLALLWSPFMWQICEVLSRLMRMAAATHRRSALVALVAELDEARREVAWMFEYENDEQRYKVGTCSCVSCALCVVPSRSLKGYEERGG